jgi:hypothetical protein
MAMCQKGVGWRYRIVILFGSVLSIQLPLAILDIIWPDLIYNAVLYAIIYLLLLLAIFYPIYRFAENKLNKI